MVYKVSTFDQLNRAIVVAKKQGDTATRSREVLPMTLHSDASRDKVNMDRISYLQDMLYHMARA